MSIWPSPTLISVKDIVGAIEGKFSFLGFPKKRENPQSRSIRVFRGAPDQNRTGDLVLTKDALVPTELQEQVGFLRGNSAPYFAPYGVELRYNQMSIGNASKPGKR